MCCSPCISPYICTCWAIINNPKQTPCNKSYRCVMLIMSRCCHFWSHIGTKQHKAPYITIQINAVPNLATLSLFNLILEYWLDCAGAYRRCMHPIRKQYLEPIKLYLLFKSIFSSVFTQNEWIQQNPMPRSPHAGIAFILRAPAKRAPTYRCISWSILWHWWIADLDWRQRAASSI